MEAEAEETEEIELDPDLSTPVAGLSEVIKQLKR